MNLRYSTIFRCLKVSCALAAISCVILPGCGSSDVAEGPTKGVSIELAANEVGDGESISGKATNSESFNNQADYLALELPDEEETSSTVSTNDDDRNQESKSGEYNKLGNLAQYVILKKGTERPSDEGYTLTHDAGTYICRQCNAMLYRAEDKFDSHCGWPSFDDEIPGAVSRNIDADGYRVEIVCANCDGHLGHVFEGERKTAKNVRHCVNSISMVFVPEGEPLPAKIVKQAAAKNE